MFRVYPKIQSLHKEECDGILNGICYIQEKIDGANASIWLHEDGTIHYGSRSRDLVEAKDNFNGFGDWIKDNSASLNGFFVNFPRLRINGEWLVRHTIGYNETSYKQFYAFDFFDEKTQLSVNMKEFYNICFRFGIKSAYLFSEIRNPTLDQIKEYAGKSVLGKKGEGVVIKNLDFINKFGNPQFGKYVTQEFKEDNAITFGGNNKSSETYNEMYYVNKYLTLARVQKAIHKIEATDGRPDYKHIPKVMGLVYYDLITEEAWTIAQEMAKSGKMFDFKAFKQFCDKKTKQIFIEIITGDISVAHQEN